MDVRLTCISPGKVDSSPTESTGLADRGFTLTEEFVVAYNATLQVPTFMKGKKQLERSNTEETRNLAHVHIHVERVIG